MIENANPVALAEKWQQELKMADWGSQKAITIFWPDQGRIQRIYQDGSCNNDVGRINASGYKTLRHSKKMHLAHRLLWEKSKSDCLGAREIDHIDGDKLNNRIDNLRVVTRKQNMENQSKPFKNNLLGVKGVKRTKNGKFQARIRSNSKLVHLGTFLDIESAQDAYMRAAAKYHTHNPSAKEQQ
jgi:hypothetical protein